TPLNGAEAAICSSIIPCRAWGERRYHDRVFVKGYTNRYLPSPGSSSMPSPDPFILLTYGGGLWSERRLYTGDRYAPSRDRLIAASIDWKQSGSNAIRQ